MDRGCPEPLGAARIANSGRPEKVWGCGVQKGRHEDPQDTYRGDNPTQHGGVLAVICWAFN